MTETVTDLEIIQDLDFKIEPPCEHSQHTTDPDHRGPAFYLLRCVSPCGCKDTTFYICKQGYELTLLIHCSICGQAGGVWHKDEVWTIIGTVR